MTRTVWRPPTIARAEARRALRTTSDHPVRAALSAVAAGRPVDLDAIAQVVDTLDGPARQWADKILDTRGGAMAPLSTLNLADELTELLADVVSFSLRANGAHWNVTGTDFAEFHTLFGAIYDDVHDSIDPIAENLRKIGAPAPFRLPDLVALRSIDDAPVGTDAPGLCRDLADANTALIGEIAEAFDCATACGQQGIANFLADRMDQHQKWAWQLAATLGDQPAPIVDPDPYVDEPADSAMGDEVLVDRSGDDDPEVRRALLERADKVTFDAELRADNDSTTIRGYAVRWNVEADGLSFREVIAPGAFTRSLQSEQPVFLLVNHDADMVPLASTKSGTLRLRQDDHGLAMEADLDPANPRAQELLSALRRGDLDKMSFAFSVEPGGENRQDGVRTITAARLYEVSVVAAPAYSATSVGLRSDTNDLERRRRRLALLYAR